MKESKRFLPLKDHKGIRKDTVTGKFQARKYIAGKEFSETFDKLSQAIQWKKVFHPLLTEKEITNSPAYSVETSVVKTDYLPTRPNGVDTRFTFYQVWELYLKQHIPSMEVQSRNDLMKRANNFFPDFYQFKMTQINAELVDLVLRKKVQEAKEKNNPRRFGFRLELKTLRAFLNWYRENYDMMFMIPILKRHFTSAVVKPKPVTHSKKMTIEQVKRFLDAFDDPFWRDFAELHFFMAGRIQEISGLQWESIDFDNNLLRVSDVSVWGYNKKFIYLKEIPKNGELRVVHLNSRMIEILKRRYLKMNSLDCEFFRESNGKRLNFVFHADGQPLNYRRIQYQYNKALEDAGLFPEFRATHILRKAMANIVRQTMGLDAAQAAGGWRSREVVEKIYTDAPSELNREAVNFVEQILTGTTGTTGTDLSKKAG